MSKPMFGLEQVYDEQISPLMTQIIAICKEHQLPMFATFMYQRTEEDGEGLCTTSLLFEGRAVPKNVKDAANLVARRHSIPMLRTTLVKADGSKETTITAFLDDDPPPRGEG